MNRRIAWKILYTVLTVDWNRYKKSSRRKAVDTVHSRIRRQERRAAKAAA